MENVQNLKSIGQNSVNRLIDLGKQQPEEVKTWGITAAAAVGGALAVAATAQGILSIVATLAAPPVALTVGAVAGGLAGWSLLQHQKENKAAQAASANSQPSASENATPATNLEAQAAG